MKGLAAAVMDDHYTVGTEVMMGDPVDMLTGAPVRLTCLLSGRTDVERSSGFSWVASPMRSLHGVPCPVLVVR